jgi:hypothetical protein
MFTPIFLKGISILPSIMYDIPIIFPRSHQQNMSNIHRDDITLLAQGQTQGSTLTTHQQALTTGPFGNTCEADAVSPEVAIGGCRTHVSTTRGNTKWI